MIDWILIDTDILIDAARSVPDAVTFLEHVDQESSGVISSITQMELIVGCRNKDELLALDQFLNRFSIIHLTPDISEIAVELLKIYRLSHGLLIPDALIASTALAFEYSFATKNQRHFQFIKNLHLLSYPKTFSNLKSDEKSSNRDSKIITEPADEPDGTQ